MDKHALLKSTEIVTSLYLCLVLICIWYLAIMGLSIPSKVAVSEALNILYSCRNTGSLGHHSSEGLKVCLTASHREEAPCRAFSSSTTKKIGTMRHAKAASARPIPRREKIFI